jgi:GntR family transcriptional regulator, gluconate operon transcriptional repressor
MAPSLKDPWEGVRDTLRERILSGELRPGERILEVPLAEQLGLSRGPIREALRVLVAEGLVVRQPRLGAIVVPIDERTVDEVYSLRTALETFAVQRAFERHEGNLSLQLLVPLEQMREALDEGRPNAVLEPDIAFHRALVQAADNGRLLATWEGLVGPLRILLGLTARRGSDEHRRSLLGHEQIYERVKARDVAGTVETLTAHLDTARDMVLAYLRESQRGEAERQLARSAAS